MKQVFFIFILNNTLAACNVWGDRNKITSITGTYTSQSESEYSKAMDTLIITLYNERADTYLIKRKTGFHKIRNGQIMEKEYKTEELLAVWDGKTSSLQEFKHGRMYSFPSSGTEILSGMQHYKKSIFK
jgi:hypothetical protein